MNYCLDNISVMMSVGVCEHEKKAKQEIGVMLYWTLDLDEAAVLNDDLSAVVDYSEVYDLVRKLENKPHTELIEKVKIELEADLKKAFPKMKDLRVWLEKKPFPDANIRVGN